MERKKVLVEFKNLQMNIKDKYFIVKDGIITNRYSLKYYKPILISK